MEIQEESKEANSRNVLQIRSSSADSNLNNLSPDHQYMSQNIDASARVNGIQSGKNVGN